MKHILITGSNGMIGKLILEYCLQREDAGSITSITRKSTGIHHPKLVELIHDDFLDYSAVAEHLKNKDICFFCLGVYTGQVAKEEFRTITVDYTRALATALKQYSPEAGFCFLSGQGADITEKSVVMFARDKGIAENILINLQFQHLAIFRPGYIYPVTPRVEPNTLYKIFRLVYRMGLGKIYPNIGVTSEQLAKVMVSVGFEGKGTMIYENRDIRKLA